MIMVDNLYKIPKKGILKNSSSFEIPEQPKELPKETKWDEMNILATFHPKDKDYGHMKIEEPKTPYSYEAAENSGDEFDGLDAELLAEKIKIGGSDLPKVLNEEEEKESSEDEEMPEEKAKRKAFEMKRKQHYNEFAAVKLARKLMEEDEENEDEGTKEDVDKENESEDEQSDSKTNNNLDSGQSY